MILTHEPTFATALAGEADSVVAAKRALCEQVDIPIVRLHDHMHFTEFNKMAELMPDLRTIYIDAGEVYG